jgi:hypothetical protein
MEIEKKLKRIGKPTMEMDGWDSENQEKKNHCCRRRGTSFRVIKVCDFISAW